jgi:hypothetical protein
MQATDRKKFVATLAGLAAVKPGKELTPEALEIWWSSMRGWTIEEFVTAASHLASSVEFMPSPFHFEELRKATKPTVGEAWTEALRRCPQWRAGKVWDDAIERAVMAIGGYRAIAMADLESALPHIERRFKEAYEEQDDVETVRQALPHLTPAPGINFRDGKFTAIAAPLAGGRGVIGEAPKLPVHQRRLP